VFPRRVYTRDEVHLAKALIDKGHRHRLRIIGSPTFKEKTKAALRLVKTAKHYGFLRTYVRAIREVEGLSQLREEQASIWANVYAVENAVDAACFFVQKSWQMKNFIEGKAYYGHQAETESVKVRLSFLEDLRRQTDDPAVRAICEERLQMWNESKYF
jgi:hypothetical protein